MSFSKITSLFGGGGGETETARPDIQGPGHLRKGDFVEFGFLPVPELSNRRFQVRAVNDVEYGHGTEHSLTLHDGTTTIGMSGESGDQGPELVLSRLLSRAEVLQIFDADTFGAVFEEGISAPLSLIARPDALAPWLDDKGYQENVDAVQARFREDGSLSWAKFDFYELEGLSDARFRVEIEVYDGGETEVYACRSFRPDAVEKYWPAGAV